MSNNRFPAQIKYIIGNEACERFSYYGIRSILALYISQVLCSTLPAGVAKDRATELIHLFIFANYITPLLGGWLSDKILGRYNTIFYISLVYSLGNLILALGTGTVWGLYIGLGLIALGSGGIKPCVSAFCGDQFKPEQSGLLQKAYGLFYWSINFGSFFSFLVIPWLKNDWGYRIAFGVPGVLMLTATLIFWLGRKYYVCIPPTRQTKSAGFFKVIWRTFMNRRRRSGVGFWKVAAENFSEREVAGARSVGPILAVFAPITIFWALFDQTSSTWVLQGSKMLPMQLSESFAIGPEQMQSMNPFLVMLLVPLTLWIYPKIERMGIRVSPLRRMGTGMILAALAYVVVGFFQTRLDAGVQMSVLWQTLPYLILTTAEVLISTTGLEFAFTQAGAEMKSTIMSFWLMTVAMGNLIVWLVTVSAGWLAKVDNETFLAPLITKLRGFLMISQSEGASAAVNSSTFYLYAGMTFFVAIIFVFIAMGYKERTLELASVKK